MKLGISFFKKIFFLFLFLFPTIVLSSIDDYFPASPFPSPSNYGETGLLNMPNARLMNEGSLRFGISSSYPLEYTTIVASPFDWLEASYRYTEIENRLYSDTPAFSGNQSFKDKAFDLKIRIFKEKGFMPSIAVGLRDIAGTGVFSSEYLAMSKRLGRLDVTAGIGWGYLGLEGNIQNPLLSLHDSFKFRDSQVGQGGKFNLKDFYSGDRAALFFGLEYPFLKRGLSLKLEYDTTNPELDFPGRIPLNSESKLNMGLVYSAGNWLDISISLERGLQPRISFFLKGAYGERNIVSKNDKPLNVASLNEQQKEKISKNKDLLYRSLNLSLKEERLYLQAATLKEDKLEIVIAQDRFRSQPRALGRSIRIASSLTPDSINKIKAVAMNGDLEIGSIEVNKEEFKKGDKGRISVSEVLQVSLFEPPEVPAHHKRAEFQPTVRWPEIFWKMQPALNYQIGGPEAFFLGQLWWRTDVNMKIRRNLSLYTSLGVDIYNNFDKFNNPSASEIPHVRSDIQEYLSEGQNNISRFKFEYLWSPYKDIYTRFDAGMLENMFGGYGGEILYRPFDHNYAVGLTLHNVRQREYRQRFGFRDYKTTTGHLTFYNDWPKNISSSISVGKYLAGDSGVTLDLSRGFKTGFRVGVFATKTNLSAEEFGEGSFDKGFYFSIPTDVFYSYYQTGNIPFGLHPLTKDGGAKLLVNNSLYALLGETNKSSFIRDWFDIFD